MGSETPDLSSAIRWLYDLRQLTSSHQTSVSSHVVKRSRYLSPHIHNTCEVSGPCRATLGLAGNLISISLVRKVMLTEEQSEPKVT